MYHDTPNFHTSTMRAVEALIERHVPPSLAERKGLPTADEVRELTKDWPRARPMVVTDRSIAAVRERKPAPQAFPCDDPPQTWPDKVAAARKAVSLVRQNVGLSAALQRCGLASCYSVALRQCVTGSGPLFDAANGGPIPTHAGRHHLAFCRWFLDRPGVNGHDDPDNEKLREALKRSGMSIRSVAAAAGLNFDGLSAFARGKTKRFKASTRAKVWDVLNSRN
jgi:hypothetical protein